MNLSDYYGTFEVTINGCCPVLLCEKEFEIIRQFQSNIFKRVYNFNRYANEIQTDHYLGLLHRENNTLNFDAMTRVNKNFVRFFDCDPNNKLTLSNFNATKDTLVTPKHALSKISTPLRVADPESLKSITEPFADQTKAHTYKDYFNIKYNIELTESETLVPVKHLKMVLNCIKEIDFSVRKKSKSKPIELPRSLCCVYPLPYGMWRKLCIMPSVLYNLKQYTTAQYLLQRIATSSELSMKQNALSKLKQDAESLNLESRLNSASTLNGLSNLTLNDYSIDKLESIRTALVTISALEDRSNELLEFYGDSVLKYVVTISLFLQKPYFNEHALNYMKCKLVNNELLYTIGMSRQLYSYLFYEKFEPQDFELYLSQDDMSSSKKYLEHSNKLISDAAEGLIGVFFTQDQSNIAWLNLLEWYGFKLEPLKRFLLTNKYQKWCFEESESPDESQSHTGYMFSTLQSLQKALNYQFKDELLLIEALSHSSLSRRINQSTQCNQRLEFIGDSVIEIMITTEIMHRNKRRTLKYDQGQLSDIRSSLVCTYILAVVATRLRLHKYLRVMDFRTSVILLNFVEKLETMTDRLSENFIDANVLITDNFSEIVEVPKDLADCMEALIGAVYIDLGGDLQATWNVFKIWFNDLIDFYFEKVPPSIFIYLQKLCPDGEFFQLPRSMNGYHNWRWVGNNMEIISNGKTSKVTKSKVAAEALRRIRKKL